VPLGWGQLWLIGIAAPINPNANDGLSEPIPALSTWIHFPISGYLVNVGVNAAREIFLQRCISAN
jgi:hypothetical protein